MQPPSTQPPKPVSSEVHPEITRLPALTRSRLFFRRLMRAIARLLVSGLGRPQVNGLENYPHEGAALLVTNHLGDADAAMALAFFPVLPDTLAKAELYTFPVLGKVMETFGVIWIHRGRPDRRAIRTALQGLQEGRLVAIAPEGRESATGSLEEGTSGAAYLALKAGVPVVPITFTGTSNAQVFGALKRLRRPVMTLTVGPSFFLTELPDRKESLEQGTRQIMQALARQLPPEYQGAYRLQPGD